MTRQTKHVIAIFAAGTIAGAITFSVVVALPKKTYEECIQACPTFTRENTTPWYSQCLEERPAEACEKALNAILLQQRDCECDCTHQEILKARDYVPEGQ